MNRNQRRKAVCKTIVPPTAGDWMVEPDEWTDCRDLAVVSPGAGVICHLDCTSTPGGHVNDPQAWADARLLAASPKLFKLAKETLASLIALGATPERSDPESMPCRLRDIIAQVEGKT